MTIQSNKPSKFRAKNWVGINDDASGMYNANSQTKFTITMLKSSLYDCSDVYILFNGTITITGGKTKKQAKKQADEGDKEVILKNFGPLNG